ncbi:MAG: nucleotidyltransferase domain-containing protein [Candidatus Hydrogenedentota bacterium]
MISEKDKAIILKYAKKYKLTTVILFGSSVEKENANDIDIGIKGIEPGRFFEFYGELLLSLSKRIDIVDLNKENSFNKLVEKEGIKLYG